MSLIIIPASASSSTSRSRFPAIVFLGRPASTRNAFRLFRLFTEGNRHGEAQSFWVPVKRRVTVQMALDASADDSSAIALGMRRLDRRATGLNPLQLQMARAHLPRQPHSANGR